METELLPEPTDFEEFETAVAEGKESHKPKPSIKIRDARIYDIPQIVDMMEEFVQWQRRLGNKIYTNGSMLRGGVVLEVGASFHDNMCKVIVAEKNGIIVGLLIAQLEHCGPMDKFATCVRIKADYIKDKSLRRPAVLRAMWNKLLNWGGKFEVGYYYGLIHPGNQPSIRTAKEAGFRHHTTQFLRLAQEEEE